MSLLKIFKEDLDSQELTLGVFNFFGDSPEVITQIEAEAFGKIQMCTVLGVNKDTTIPFKLKLPGASIEYPYSRWMNLGDNRWVKNGVEKGDITALYVKML